MNLRADVVGSLLRPPALLQAREKFANKAMAAKAFKGIEDRAVSEAVALQDEAGLKVVTDGEMRRLSFQSQMTESVDGFGEYDLNAFLWGDWHGDERVGEQKSEIRAAHFLGRHRKTEAAAPSFRRRIHLPPRTGGAKRTHTENHLAQSESLGEFLASVPKGRGLSHAGILSGRRRRYSSRGGCRARPAGGNVYSNRCAALHGPSGCGYAGLL